MGEFTEVFVTTPFIFENKLKSLFSKEGVMYVISPFLRKFYTKENQELRGHPGGVIAEEINRGYGFASNIISEAYFFLDGLEFF